MEKMLFLLTALTILSASSVASELPSIKPVTSCTSLKSFNPQLADYPTFITDASAEQINGVSICRVVGYISPQVHFEVLLPESGWTQRYLQVGCGGLCGSIRLRAPQRACPALQRGEFVIAATDMGHSGSGGAWGALDQQLRIDFGYRGQHATAVVAKALIARFYGQAPRFSYFSGCSDGGREGLMEAQRFPNDFDGIAAGAPAMNFLVQNTLHHGWQARQSVPDGKTAVLSAVDMPILHAAAVKACDANDGVRDGLISDPLGCKFDPLTIQCKGNQSAGCLTQKAAHAAAEIYAGAHDEKGRKLVVGGLMRGSELAWPGVAVPREPNMQPGSANFANDTIPWLAFPKPLAPGWTLADFRFEESTLRALLAMHGIYDATDPDLSRFASRNGKLLMWHGLSDHHISPANTVAYAQAVADQLGDLRSASALRTFLIPGMYHCGSGDGLTSIDVLTPLMAWVEDGIAPDHIVASKNDADAVAGKGRPIFAWPASGTLKIGADPDLPANWTHGSSNAPANKLYMDWLGSDFYKPGYHRECGFDGQEYECHAAK